MDNQSVTRPQNQVFVRIRLALENVFEIHRYCAQAAVVALASPEAAEAFPKIAGFRLFSVMLTP